MPPEAEPVSDPDSRSEAWAPVKARFGVILAGVPVLFPGGVITEFVVQASVYPVPRAPQRLLGLMQVRGQPVPVFDAALHPPRELPLLRRRDVLVVGTGMEAGALAIESAPRQLALIPLETPPAVPESCFAEAVEGAYYDPSEPQRVWWQLAPSRLFTILARRVDGQ